MFNIYMGKPVGPRFAQMVSKTPEWKFLFELACTIWMSKEKLNLVGTQCSESFTHGFFLSFYSLYIY